MDKQGQGATPARGFSWLIAVLLLLSRFINYIDRQTLAVLVRFLPPGLKMSNIVYGRIQALFLLAYALSMPLARWAVDRFPFASLVVKAATVPAVLAILAIGTFFIQGFFANIFSLPADLFPHEKVTWVFGLNAMYGSLAGFLTVQAVGLIVERFSYTPVFLLLALLLPAGALCAQMLVRSGARALEGMPAAHA